MFVSGTARRRTTAAGSIQEDDSDSQDNQRARPLQDIGDDCLVMVISCDEMMSEVYSKRDQEQ